MELSWWESFCETMGKLVGNACFSMYKWMLHPLREGIGFKPIIEGKEKYEEEQEEKEKEEGRGGGKPE